VYWTIAAGAMRSAGASPEKKERTPSCLSISRAIVREVSLLSVEAWARVLTTSMGEVRMVAAAKAPAPARERCQVWSTGTTGFTSNALAVSAVAKRRTAVPAVAKRRTLSSISFLLVEE